MKVTLRTQQASQPFFFDDVNNAYTKDNMYCLRLTDGATLKFPLVHIFSIREEKGYSSQKEPNGN